MPLKKMSRNEVIGDIPTHFFKSGGILRSSEGNKLTPITRLFPQDRKIEYDVWYDMNDKDRVHGYCYTDALNELLYIRPACHIRAYQTMIDAVKSDITDEGEYIFSRIAAGNDKYRLRQPMEYPDFVVFMAGTNIWNKISNVQRIHNAVDQGAKLKCHPLTAPPMRAYLKVEFGEENIIEPKVSGHALLENAKIVGSYTNSEMGLAALAKGKTVYLLNDLREQYTYSAIYNAISPGGFISVERFKRILSCKSSGLVPCEAPNPQEYIDGFFKRYEDVDDRLSSS